jgi:RNA polymerase sigma factor (sigma-70 family)
VWSEGWPQSSQAFEPFIEFFQDRLFWFSFRKIGSREIAEEIVQEVFIKVFTDRKNLTHVENITSYLYRMIDNSCIDRLRKKKFEHASVR